MSEQGANQLGALSEAELELAAEVAGRVEDLRGWASYVWDHPELAHQERRSAACLAQAIRADGGFDVEMGPAGLETAFVARTERAATPVVAYLAEYDALPAMSNVAEPRRAPVAPGAPGHGCHHHLLGAASVLAGLSLRQHLASSDELSPGAIWIVGCPAEEADGGKIQLLREGAFAGVDFAVAWHPEETTFVCRGGSLALITLSVSFRGRASHAAIAPHLGRSALDAALSFMQGLEFLREHLPDGARIHYVLRRGGAQPNVVPDHAEVEVYLRAKTVGEVEHMLQRLGHVARGADRMAWTDWYGDAEAGYRPPEVVVDSAYWPTLHNRTASAVLERILAGLGPIPFLGQDHDEAREFQQALGVDPVGLDGTAVSTPEAAAIGSSDVGDLSWNVPLVELNAATLPVGIPVHSWAAVGCGKREFAFKGALRAAQAMAVMGYRYLCEERLRRKIADEFDHTTAGVEWRTSAGTRLTLTP
ncbi:MAG: amidohydrolase [Deltaproteobacteria bacterium]|jgi:aminobenzoyl-glutamate utilization protein B|nr:amidohydrolase [Deltaproteobacteria bacterium]MBW2533046.1 amidohydrolase [Deltaproteobacteria bacterium]